MNVAWLVGVGAVSLLLGFVAGFREGLRDDALERLMRHAPENVRDVIFGEMRRQLEVWRQGGWLR